MENIGHLLAWAVQLELTLDELLKLLFYHPVVEEGLRSALKNADRKFYEERSEKPPALPIMLRVAKNTTAFARYCRQ